MRRTEERRTPTKTLRSLSGVPVFFDRKCGRSSLLFPALLVYGKEEHGVGKAVGTANEFLSAG